MKSVTIEGTNFNATHLATKTWEEFYAEFENTPVYKNYSSEDRIKLLQDAYAKCREAAGVADQPPVAAPASAPAATTTSGRPPKTKEKTADNESEEK